MVNSNSINNNPKTFFQKISRNLKSELGTYFTKDEAEIIKTLNKDFKAADSIRHKTIIRSYVETIPKDVFTSLGKDENQMKIFLNELCNLGINQSINSFDLFIKIGKMFKLTNYADLFTLIKFISQTVDGGIYDKVAQFKKDITQVIKQNNIFIASNYYLPSYYTPIDVLDIFKTEGEWKPYDIFSGKFQINANNEIVNIRYTQLDHDVRAVRSFLKRTDLVILEENFIDKTFCEQLTLEDHKSKILVVMDQDKVNIEVLEMCLKNQLLFAFVSSRNRTPAPELFV